MSDNITEKLAEALREMQRHVEELCAVHGHPLPEASFERCGSALAAYDAAPRAVLEPLTKEQRDDIAQRVVRYPFLSPMGIVDEVERLHGIGLADRGQG